MSEKTVAVLGASADRSKYGNKSVRAHLEQGFKVYPVNPKGEPIEGLETYRSLEEVPVDKLDRISVYLPPHITLEMLPAIKQANAEEFWLNPGSESAEVVAKAQELGLEPIMACSIVDVGSHPGNFTEA